MFADPQSITFNSVATSFPRTGSGIGQGTFQTADGAYVLKISSQYGKRNRRTIRIDQRKTAADPFNDNLNQEVSCSVYLVVDSPKQGFTVAELKYVVDGLVDYLDASTGAKVTQLLGGEA